MQSTKVRPTVTDVAWSVLMCLCVCCTQPRAPQKGNLFLEAQTRRSVTSDTRRHRKTLTYLLSYKKIEVRFGLRSVIGPRNHVLGIGLDLLGEGAVLLGRQDISLSIV